jgi:glycosyltransferase involved in cell wall biosynthesis
LVIAGTGEEKYLEELRRQGAGLKLTSVDFVFEFLSAADMIGLLQAADILVYPYREITTSGALMTGVVQAKPIIATDLEPFREVLDDSRTGLLIPYGDLQAMAGALFRLINDADERRRLSQGIRADASRTNTWEMIAGNTHSCYQSVLAHTP